MTTTRRGTSREYALKRLNRSAPDLHRKVLAGEMSAHGAMIEAGLRPKRITLLLSSADSVAAGLCRQVPPDMLAEVVDKLSA